MKRILLLGLMTLGAIALLVGCTDKHHVVDVVGEIPAVPVGVSSTTGDRQVDVYWSANNDNGLTKGYGVYRYTRTVNGVDEYELLGTVSASSGIETYSYIDRNLANGVKQWYAVNAYNDFGESELSKAELFDTPRPEGVATLRDFHQYPADAGWDFSQTRVVRFDSDNADVYFEYDPELRTFFLFAGSSEIDIQDYGYTSDLTSVGWGDPGGGEGWSAVGWLELIVHHSYIVWTADDHYATIRVEAMNSNPGQLSVEIRWAYQTDTGNPELKRGVVTRPQHDANYGKRKG